MNDRIAGIPLYVWAVGMVAGIYGFMWMRRRSGGTTSSTTATGTPPGQPVFTQAQEVQDFQVFSALTGQQQGSDLNFLTEVAQLFAGGASGGNSGSPQSTYRFRRGASPPNGGHMPHQYFGKGAPTRPLPMWASAPASDLAAHR